MNVWHELFNFFYLCDKRKKEHEGKIKTLSIRVDYSSAKINCPFLKAEKKWNLFLTWMIKMCRNKVKKAVSRRITENKTENQRDGISSNKRNIYVTLVYN